MFGTIRFVIATVFFLVIFAYALAPALSQVTKPHSSPASNR